MSPSNRRPAFALSAKLNTAGATCLQQGSRRTLTGYCLRTNALLLMEVIKDVPLDFSAEHKTAKPNDVKELVFRRRPNPENLPTITVWQVTRWDGRQYQASHLYNTSFRKMTV